MPPKIRDVLQQLKDVGRQPPSVQAFCLPSRVTALVSRAMMRFAAHCRNSVNAVPKRADLKKRYVVAIELVGNNALRTCLIYRGR